MVKELRRRSLGHVPQHVPRGQKTASARLRHSNATRVRKDYGLAAARVLLGHSQADVTQVYAERNHGLAATAAAKIG